MSDLNTNCYAAVDLGASSGRVLVGYIDDRKILLKEIHRFDNIQKRIDNHDCWDIDMLLNNILEGLKKCKEAGYTPKSIGIDTWGVDFVSVDKAGNIVGHPVAYRDDRTKGIMDRKEPISFEKIYEYAGIQKLQFNSLYQIVALKEQNPEIYDATDKFLFIPDYLNYKLCGIKSCEYSISSTSSMLNAQTCDWDKNIFSTFEIDKDKFFTPQMPGNILGPVTKEVEEYIGYSTDVCQVASHDTASAYLSVPAINNNSVYLSSGTWSLLGCEIDSANTSELALQNNFTNEGGYNKRYRFLKNIMGLWIIQSVRRELNGIDYVDSSDEASKTCGKDKSFVVSAFNDFEDKEYSFPDLSEAAKSYKGDIVTFNVNDDRFLSPKSMIAEILDYYNERNIEVPKTLSHFMQCIYVSLVDCYKTEIENLEKILNKKFDTLNIVGGGCQDTYLNELIAKQCNIDVCAGPIEATALGNLAVQMINSKDFSNINEFRNALFGSFNIIKYK